MFQELDEQSLAGLCSEKNSQALDELYTRYAARLYTLCRRYSDNADEAQDLMHESFLKAFGKISSFKYRAEGSLYAWISKIAVNTALAGINRRKLHFINLPPLISENLSEPTDEEFLRIPQEKLLDFISDLPYTQRTIFNLFCLDGYSHKEIAELLGISERGSTSLLAKARTLLRKRIKEYIKNSE